MSPTVPPNSHIMMSQPDSSAAALIEFLIAFVMWGIIWIVFPRKVPLRSPSSTSEYIFPVVTDESFDKCVSMKRS